MATFDQRTLAWLRTHHGTLAASQQGEGGLTSDERRHLVAAGVLERVVNGAYAFSGVEPDELTRCAALCTSRPHLVVAGPTAARLWALRRAPRDGLVHVIAPPASNPCREAWVRPYRTAAIAPDEIVTRRDGIRLTSPPRTVLDMARFVSDVDVASMIEHLLERGMCTEETLARSAQRFASPGRPWIRRVTTLLDARRPGAPAQSEWERRVHEELGRRGLDGVVRQWHVDLPGYGRARFDLAIPEIRWALEIDVHPEHRTMDGAARDNVRDAAAEAIGWVVRRVAELQLTRDLQTTLDALMRSIEDRRVASEGQR